LIATDVAARGIDVTRISHVINFEPPIDAKQYIHRAGRTGRMGRRGTVITLVTVGERSLLARHSAKLGIELKQKTLSHGEWVDADLAANRRDSRKASDTDRGRNRKDGVLLANREDKEHWREPNQMDSRRESNVAQSQNGQRKRDRIRQR